MIILFLGIKVDFVGRLFAGIVKGARDECVSHFTDHEVSVSNELKDMIKNCEPWSQHLTKSGLKQMNQALSQGNLQKAKEAIETGKIDTSAPWCISALKIAVVFVCTKCPTILKEALPSSYY